MDKGLPEIDKSEAMQKHIILIAERLAALERKLDAIARHVGVSESETVLSAEEMRKR